MLLIIFKKHTYNNNYNEIIHILKKLNDSI
jgi:hypothetical protein